MSTVSASSSTSASPIIAHPHPAVFNNGDRRHLCPFYQSKYKVREFEIERTDQVYKPSESILRALIGKVQYAYHYIVHSYQAISGVITGTFNGTSFRVHGKPGQYKEVAEFNSFIRRTVTVTDPSIYVPILNEERNGEGAHSCFNGGMNDDVARAITGNHNPVTSSEAEHQFLRGVLLPHFESKKVKDHVSAFETQALEISKDWNASAAVNISSEMRKFTLRAVTEQLFGLSNPPEELQKAISSLVRINVKQFFLPRWITAISNFFTNEVKEKKEAEDVIRLAVQHGMKSYKDGTETDKKGSLLADMKNAGLSDQQIIDTVKLLVVTGQEKTASLLVSLIYQLSVNPELIFAIRDELNHSGYKLLFDRISKSPTLGKVYSEGLRLYPPVPVISRQAVANLALTNAESGEGYFIEKGKTINVDLCYSFLDERRAGPSPQVFDPTRFNRLDIQVDTDEAFGSGPGECLGKHFTMIQVGVVLATLITHFDWTSETKAVRPSLKSIATLVAADERNIVTKIFDKIRGKPFSEDIFIKFDPVTEEAI